MTVICTQTQREQEIGGREGRREMQNPVAKFIYIENYELLRCQLMNMGLNSA